MGVYQRYFAFALSLLLAVGLLGCASSSDRSVGTRVDDQAIETRVKAALIGAKDVSGTAIQVEVRNGEVQLSGFVKSQAEVQRAIDISKGVSGVTRVINKMSVRS